MQTTPKRQRAIQTRTKDGWYSEMAMPGDAMKYLLLLPLFLIGCSTNQGRAIDMVEYMIESECSIKAVSVRKTSYRIETNC